jgi:hypothetical protein
MSHPSVSVSLRAAGALMGIKLLLHLFNADFTYEEEVYLFLLLAAFPALVLYAIRPRGKPSSFKEDVLASLRVTAVFAVAMTLFIYAFYAFVDQNYFPNMVDMIVSREMEADPDLDEEKLRNGVESFFSIRNFAVMAILFFLVMCAFYSVLFSAIKRLVIR